MKKEEVIETTKAMIQTLRGARVVIDADLAKIYGVETKRLNEQVKRNESKFPEDFMFQLSEEEWSTLKSQNVTTKALKSQNATAKTLKSQNATADGRGGRRSAPFAFTEHGVLQAANVINSALADSISVFVIRAFVEMRETIALQEAVSRQKKSQPTASAGEQKLGQFLQDIRPKLQQAVSQIMDTVIDAKHGTSVRQEAQDIISESIAHLKSRLQKTGLENEEVVARITKLMAEAEKDRAQSRKTTAETEQLEFLIMVRKLKLVLEAQRLFHSGAADEDEVKRMDGFIHILREQSS